MGTSSSVQVALPVSVKHALRGVDVYARQTLPQSSSAMCANLRVPLRTRTRTRSNPMPDGQNAHADTARLTGLLFGASTVVSTG